MFTMIKDSQAFNKYCKEEIEWGDLRSELLQNCIEFLAAMHYFNQIFPELVFVHHFSSVGNSEKVRIEKEC